MAAKMASKPGMATTMIPFVGRVVFNDRSTQPDPINHPPTCNRPRAGPNGGICLMAVGGGGTPRGFTCFK